jgi:hypothetical protein
LARGQNRAALSGRFISWPGRSCQRLLSTNRRIAPENLSRLESLDFFELYAALEPQYCDVLPVLSVKSSDAAGAAGDFLPRDWRSQRKTRRLFLTTLETSRDLRTIVVRDPAGALALPEPRLLFPEHLWGMRRPNLLTWSELGSELSEGVFECWWKFGGRWFEPQDVTRRLRARDRDH